jgi:hypothetical protein
LVIEKNPHSYEGTFSETCATKHAALSLLSTSNSMIIKKNPATKEKSTGASLEGSDEK